MTAKLALCNEVIRGLDFPRQCAFARDVGYDGLEIAPFTLFDMPRIDAARVREMKTTADGEGVALTGLHWLLRAPEGLSITTEDAALFRRTVEVGASLVALCAELGGTYLVHGSPPQRRLRPGRETAGKARALDYFSKMAEAAAAANVVYCVEPLAPPESDWINSVEEAMDLVEAVGSPSLETMIDCAAVARAGGDVVAELRRWLPGGHIRHIHFNDPNMRGPGQGDLSFAPIVQTLAELNYAGAAGVEPFVYVPDGMAAAARAAGYLRGLMEARAA